MTEDQAKTKWCLRLLQYRDDIRNNDSNKCCGSDCMAWRLELVPIEAKSNSGYCGLAGKP
jgi:hypothetical protein